MIKFFEGVFSCAIIFRDQPAGDRHRSAGPRSRTALGASKEWTEALIRSFYTLIAASPDDAGQINWFAQAASFISHAQSDEECRVGKVDFLGLTYTNRIFGDLAKTDGWAARAYIPLVFLQVWLPHAAKGAAFLAHLDGKFPRCLDAAKYIAADSLAPHAAALLKTPGSTPPTGELELAFILLKKAGNADAKAYLLSVVGGKPHFDKPHLDLLKGFASEETIFEKLGIPVPGSGKPPDPKGPKTPPIVANVDLEGDGTNETFLEPFMRRARTKSGLNVREQPNAKGKLLKTLKGGDEVAIIGRVSGWYAIEADTGAGIGTGFVNSGYVKLLDN